MMGAQEKLDRLDGEDERRKTQRAVTIASSGAGDCAGPSPLRQEDSPRAGRARRTASQESLPGGRLLHGGPGPGPDQREVHGPTLVRGRLDPDFLGMRTKRSVPGGAGVRVVRRRPALGRRGERRRIEPRFLEKRRPWIDCRAVPVSGGLAGRIGRLTRHRVEIDEAAIRIEAQPDHVGINARGIVEERLVRNLPRHQLARARPIPERDGGRLAGRDPLPPIFRRIGLRDVPDVVVVHLETEQGVDRAADTRAG